MIDAPRPGTRPGTTSQECDVSETPATACRVAAAELGVPDAVVAARGAAA